jgi:hypothetical protein
MRPGKFFFVMALLSLSIIAIPATVLSGFRDYVEAKPADDQPWGGEIDASGNTDESIYAVNPAITPEPINPTPIRHIGTPLALLDYIKILFIGSPINPNDRIAISQIKIRDNSRTAGIASSPIRNKRLSSPKGR